MDSCLRWGLKPKLRIDALADKGLRPVNDQSSDQLATPIRFDGKSGEEYWLGLHNFYVITRYNHSAMYAMAVHQLSQTLRAQML